MPTQGVYCASGITKTGKITNRFAETFDDLLNTIEKLKASGVNVFVTPGTFEGFSRKAEDSVFFRSFFIDLDVNHGAVCYTSKDEALDSLDAFAGRVAGPCPSGRALSAGASACGGNFRCPPAGVPAGLAAGLVAPLGSDRA